MADKKFEFRFIAHAGCPPDRVYLVADMVTASAVGESGASATLDQVRIIQRCFGYIENVKP